ncbi:MAG: SH3 domain-containing protein [Rhodothermales bacterium]
MFRNIFFVVAAGMICLLQSASASDLKFPIVEKADGNFDTCALGQVSGVDGSDGFLAVRAGPDGAFEKIGELKNNDQIWIYQKLGNWLGVVYATDEVECSPIEEDRAVQTGGKKGWVHEDWVQITAG